MVGAPLRANAAPGRTSGRHRQPKGQVDWDTVGLVRSSGREGATADSPHPTKGTETGICPLGLSFEVRPQPRSPSSLSPVRSRTLWALTEVPGAAVV